MGFIKHHESGEIVNGFKEVGFVYLDGHGIPPSTVKDVFEKVYDTRLIVLTCLMLALECPVLPITHGCQGSLYG